MNRTATPTRTRRNADTICATFFSSLGHMLGGPRKYQKEVLTSPQEWSDNQSLALPDIDLSRDVC